MTPDTTFAAADGTRLRLAGELTIYRAAELKAALLDALRGGRGTLTIELAEVEEIDTAGVQLLLLARREAAAAGRSLRVVDASAAVRDALALLDLGDAVGLDAEGGR